MKKRFAVALGVAIAMPMSALALPASATTQPTSGSEIISSQSSASVTTSEKTEAVNGISISSGVTVLAYIQANGASKTQMKGEKLRLEQSKSLLTSYINQAGQEVWHHKTYPEGKVFVKGKDGWYHDPNCWNKVKKWTKKKPRGTIIRGKVKIVKKFVFTASSTALAQGDAAAKARAWCVGFGSEAEGIGSGNANFRTEATATATGRTKVEAEAAAKTASEGKLNLQIGSKLALEMNLKTTAEGNASADATAKAVCSDVPPPPVPDDAPLFAQFREFNDLEVNWTSDHCVTVDFPKGHSGIVFWTAEFGSFATQSKPAEDMKQVCSLYKAPSEVPVVTGGEDVITVTATDDVTGLSVTKSSKPFLIEGTAPHPM
jgi:hypothetical protein